MALLVAQVTANSFQLHRAQQSLSEQAHLSTGSPVQRWFKVFLDGHTALTLLVVWAVRQLQLAW